MSRKTKRTTAYPPLAPVSRYTHTHNQHMGGYAGFENTHIRLSPDDISFARRFSDRGTLVGGVRRALDQARLRCGWCKCCEKVTLVQHDFLSRMYPSDGL